MVELSFFDSCLEMPGSFFVHKDPSKLQSARGFVPDPISHKDTPSSRIHTSNGCRSLTKMLEFVTKLQLDFYELFVLAHRSRVHEQGL